METYTTEKERNAIDAFHTKPNYQKSATRKSDKEIARNWMIKTCGFYMDRWTITPDEAGEILTNMGLNRKLKTSRMSKYTSTMKKGLWRLSPQGIIFDEDGKLIDGQHRLESVIEADKPMDFIVFLNVPKDTPIDIGLARTTADSLRIRGNIPERLATNEMFSIANSVLDATLGPAEMRRITDEEKGAFILYYADEITFAKDASYKGSSAPIAKKAGIRAAIMCATICGCSRKNLEEFAETVNTGRWQREGQGGALVLRSMLENQKKNGGGNGGRASISNLEAVTEEAIRDYIADKPRSQRYKGVEHPFSEKIDVKEALKL